MMENIMPKWTLTQVNARFFRWGKDNCKEAYRRNREVGDGAKTIGIEMGFTTNQIDAMIDTWECYLEIAGGVKG